MTTRRCIRIARNVVIGVTFVATSSIAAEPATQRLTMAQVEAIVLDANHDVRLARFAVDGAQAGVQQADTLPNPTLSWNAASYSPQSGLGSGNLGSKRVDQIVRVDQTIERGGKRALRVAVADAQLLGKRMDLEEQRRETLQAARNAYIDLILAEKRIDVLDETRRSYDASLDAANKRLKAGDIAAADVARLRVDVLRARSDGETALADRLHAQVALAAMIVDGTDPRALQSDGRWPSFVDAVGGAGDDAGDAFRRSTSDAVDDRPDVVSARLAVRAAESSIDLARSQRTRDITVGVQIERYPGYQGTGNTVGGGVSIPLFIGNDYRGDIAHAVSDHDAAEETAARTRAAAAADAANATADLATAIHKLTTFQNGLLQAAKASADAADFAFNRGALGVMDVLDSRRTLLATRLDALAAEADYARAQAAVDAVSTRATLSVRR